VLVEAIERDGPACVWCGRELWRADLTAEHLLPRSRGGHATLENLVVACRRCNRARGPRPVTAYVRAQRDAGAAPRTATLIEALTRLAASDRRAHATYGARELALLRDLARHSPAA
jgi:5-methylcytosine-specific restriction endonuclease McrA